MPELWYGIVGVLLIAYVVLDGFDLGAGALHLFVARTDAERRQVLAAIGPYWDGNEVCLLAAGGALFVGFPKVLSAGISGFYFAIFFVLWALLLRGISIEFRSHVNDKLWRSAWDFGFAAASLVLPVLFGAALGNLVRGVPLSPEGWFDLWLFTDFRTAEPVGLLDWYTVLVGVFALAALLAHGAIYLAWKTEGAVHERSRSAARILLVVVGILLVPVTLATQYVDPALLRSLPSRPLAWLCAAVAAGGLVVGFTALARGNGLRAFLGSCAFLIGMLAATATLLFPVMVRATGDESLSLTAWNAAGDPAGLRTALGWFLVGAPLAVVYFVINFRLHRGKAVAAADGEGY